MSIAGETDVDRGRLPLGPPPGTAGADQASACRVVRNTLHEREEGESRRTLQPWPSRWTSLTSRDSEAGSAAAVEPDVVLGAQKDLL